MYRIVPHSIDVVQYNHDTHSYNRKFRSIHLRSDTILTFLLQLVVLDDYVISHKHILLRVSQCCVVSLRVMHPIYVTTASWCWRDNPLIKYKFFFQTRNNYVFLHKTHDFKSKMLQPQNAILFLHFTMPSSKLIVINLLTLSYSFFPLDMYFDQLWHQHEQNFCSNLLSQSSDPQSLSLSHLVLDQK